MCRFVAYLGKEKILIHDLLGKPEHSLIKQSRGAKEGLHGINADGFGLAWYNLNIDNEPGIFKSTHPAWNDNNLKNLSKKIESTCFLGHIRASTIGDVTLSNCHPFFYKNYAFVHNGTIHHFDKIKRALLNELSDGLFYKIKGQTDSECLFFLIMQYLKAGNLALEAAVKQAFNWIVNAQSSYNTEIFSRLNVVITDGKEIVSTRFVSKDHEPLSLNYCISYLGNTNHGSAEEKNIVIASEALNEDETLWIELPVNHYLHFDLEHSVSRVEKFQF